MKPAGGAVLLAVVSVVVVAAVVGGFIALGSPQDARRRNLDQHRIEDLQAIANSIGSEYQDRKGKDVPDSLAVRDLAPDAKEERRDPLTGEVYEFRTTGPGRFELCATFQTAVPEQDLEEWQKRWSHPAGRVCFEFDIVEEGGGMVRPIKPSGAPASRPTPPSGAR